MQNFTQIIAAISIVSAGAAGSWYIRDEQIVNLEKQIVQIKLENIELKKVNKLSYPKFLSQISTATEQLSTHLNTLENIKNLKESEKKLKVKLAEHQKKLIVKSSLIDNLNNNFSKKMQISEDRIVLLSEELKGFKSKIIFFNLSRGTGKTFKKGKINIGYSSVNSSNDTCRVTMNNKIYNLEGGGTIPFQTDKINCKILLTKCPNYTHSGNAEFQLICN